MRIREEPFGSGILYGLYQKRLRREIAELPVPQHIAIILDGNRRWARANDLETAGHGYRAGAAKFREFLVWCDDLGVKVTTLYLLSTDNLLGRAPDELSDLFEVIADLADDLSHYRNWKVQHVGSDDRLPEELLASLGAAEASA